MANAAAKKRIQQNIAELKKLQMITGVILLLFFLYRVLWLWSTWSSPHILGFVLLLAAMIFTYSAIEASAKPTYAPDGEILDGGADLSMAGLIEYYFDVMYLSWITLITTAFVSDWFWLVTLFIPGFAIYKLRSLWQNSPMSQFQKAADAAAQDPRNQKRLQKQQEKEEKKQNKVKYSRY